MQTKFGKKLQLRSRVCDASACKERQTCVRMVEVRVGERRRFGSALAYVRVYMRKAHRQMVELRIWEVPAQFASLRALSEKLPRWLMQHASVTLHM